MKGLPKLWVKIGWSYCSLVLVNMNIIPITQEGLTCIMKKVENSMPIIQNINLGIHIYIELRSMQDDHK